LPGLKGAAHAVFAGVGGLEVDGQVFRRLGRMLRQGDLRLRLAGESVGGAFGLALGRAVVGDQHGRPGQEDHAGGAEGQPQRKPWRADTDQHRAHNQAGGTDAHHRHVADLPAAELSVLTTSGVRDENRSVRLLLHDGVSDRQPILTPFVPVRPLPAARGPRTTWWRTHHRRSHSVTRTGSGLGGGLHLFLVGADLAQ
jgi:hypothetical protein